MVPSADKLKSTWLIDVWSEEELQTEATMLNVNSFAALPVGVVQDRDAEKILVVRPWTETSLATMKVDAPRKAMMGMRTMRTRTFLRYCRILLKYCGVLVSLAMGPGLL